MTFADLSPLANHLWQSTLWLAVVWLTTLALKKNRAAVRYWLWFTASAKFLIPFSLLSSIGSRLTWRAAPDIVQPQWSLAMNNVASPFAASVRTAQAVAPHSSLPIPAILIGVWLCGMVAGIVFWFRCWSKMRTARRLATPVAFNLPIPVMSSPSRIEPGVFGILRPVLLLPDGIANRLTPPQLDSILAHEICHVRRHDNLTAAIHMVVETIFWFHPLVWWIRTRLVEEREQACDEEVIRLGADPETYAEGIVGVCKSYVESPVACVSGISGFDLKRRVLRIMARRLGENLTFGKKLLLATVAIAAIAAPLAFGILNVPLLRAQSASLDWQSAAGGKAAFDVASVKQDTVAMSPQTVSSNFPLGPGNMYTPNGGLFTATNYPLVTYIAFAYKMGTYQLNKLMAELPKWVTSNRYDIQARASGNPTKDQMRLMMQALLADRFKLAIHTETQQLPVFALVLEKPGKTGPQLQPYPDSSPCDPSAATGSNRPSAPPATVAGGFPATCGGYAGMQPSVPGRVHVGARNVTIQVIADQFPGMANGVDRPVVDRTGLTGTYDFSLEFTPEIPANANFQPDASGPTFLQALKDQLGLKLDSQTGPVAVFVVDHIEEPSAN